MWPIAITVGLLIVILIALVVFTAIGRPAWLWLIASRIFLIPVIAGFSYELLKAAADRRWLAIASRPGIWLQRLTTREPSDDMVEVAIASLLAALTDEERAAVVAVGLDLKQILTADELVAGDQVFFTATGITDGLLLHGVRYHGDFADTQSMVLRYETGTRRIITTEHRVK